MEKKLSIIIPVYNEEKTILKILEKIEKVNLNHWKKEIIIVDDGSTDQTKKMLEELKNKYFVICHPKNIGKGAAIQSGLKITTGDYTIIQDADLEYDPKDYKILLEVASQKKALVIYGSRRLLKENKPSNFINLVGGIFLTWLTNFLYKTKITDEPTGYKLFQTNLLKSLNLEGKGFEFCPEVTAKIAQRGIKIYEAPIHYYPRSKEEGKKIKWQDGIIALYTLFRLRFFYEEMGFNLLDRLIRFWRFNKVKRFIPKDCILCDIGCGKSFYLLKKLSSKIKQGFGLDKEIIPISYNNLQLINSDFDNPLPLKNKSVDCITMLSVLEHLQGPVEILKECYRILKKKGQLIITTPSPKSKPILEFLALKMRVISEKEIKDHKHYFSKKEIEGLLIKSGFSDLKIETFELELNNFIRAIKK